MANTKSSKSMEVPEAKAAGSIGGEMVRRMVKNYEESQLR